MSEHSLKIRANTISFSIFTAAALLVKELSEKIDDIEKLSDETKDKLFFIIAYVLLFQAQRVIWEGMIKEECDASKFETYLFEVFEKTTERDPKPFIKDLVDYIQQGDSSREIQYVGSRICKLINKIDAFLMLEISAIYAEFLGNVFLNSLKKVWNLSDEELEDVLEKVS